MNWWEDRRLGGIAAVGTVGYGGLGPRESLKKLLSDWSSGRIAYEELIGCYSVVFYRGGRAEVMTDPEGLQAVYGLSDGSVLSSSQLAVVAAAKDRPRASAEGVVEALVTGGIVPPDTLFDGVLLVDREQQKAWSRPPVAFHLVPDDDREDPPIRSRAEAAELLLSGLRMYFRRLVAVAGDSPVHVGLSAGYDSRLLLLLAREAGFRLSTHTFSSGAHGMEEANARSVAAAAGVPIRPIQVRRWEALTQTDLDRNVEDAIYYYDGRTNQTMGSFNDVHTRSARLVALAGGGLGLTGLGGEMFRNREHLRPGPLSADQWFRYFVLTPQGVAAFRKRAALTSFMEKIQGKYARLTGVERWGHFDRRIARDIYRRVWIPYFGGVRLAAENRVSPALMPFGERGVTRSAMSCTEFIGMGGGLEAAMIKALDETVAGVTSGYGHSFSAIPWWAGGRSLGIGAVPLSARNAYGAIRAKRRCALGGAPNNPARAVGSVRAGEEILRRLRLPVDLSGLLSPGASRDRTLFLASVLGECAEALGVDV